MRRIDLAMCRLGLSLAAAGFGCGGGGPDNAQVIPITAQQFSFSPRDITIAKGTTVELDLTSVDVTHGFSLPDFSMRTDVMPGQTSKVRVTFDQAGTFTFLCDHYCGSGHEGMNGQIIVQ